MTKHPVPTKKNTVPSSAEHKPSSPSSAYAESVRMTPERLLNAVIKNVRQGGSREH